MADQFIYTVGGAVQAGGGIYIPRKADDELLAYCRVSEYAFILSSRQVGKSSLMIRTARQLESENIRSVIIDLSGIGVKISADQWYLGILNVIAKTLKLKTNLFAWWAEGAGLGPAQQMTNFFSDVLLKEVSQPVVLFFDEIDSTLSIPFADDFFAALRSVYNARSTTPEFKRLSFVMIGVATPSDLIADEKRTPFNIGHRVDLTDFTPEEAQPLAGTLGREVLGWIFHWTGGHPYLTQSLCFHLSKATEEITESSVAEAVTQLFSGERGRQDNNLQFVRDMLTKRAPDIQRVLKTYKDVRSGKKVTDDERSIPKAHLKISGVVRRADKHLQTRNRIYERAFDLAWVKDNTPATTTRRLVIALSFVTVIALMIASYFAWQEWNRTNEERASRFEQSFEVAKQNNNVQAELENLAGLFNLQGDYGLRAIKLFNQLDQKQKIELFEPVNADAVREYQVIVTLGVYKTLGFKTTADEEGDALLEKISKAIGKSAPELAKETIAWSQGRTHLNEKNYAEARDDLREAILKNPENSALYYDLARAHIGLKYYSNALDDLNTVLRLDTSHASTVRILIEKDLEFSLYWSENRNSFANLATAIPLINELVDAQGISMVLIPEGPFNMGSNSGDPNEQPVHEVNLSAYYIDKYEVTNAVYKLCVDAVVCKSPTDVSSHTRASYYGNPRFNYYPVVYVDWNMANSFCEWRSARLPTEAEWEKAARSTDGRIYPWGENIDCTYANYLGQENGCVGDTTPVGSYANGQSPYGVYDMVGNVWEWTADWYDVYPGGDPSVSTNFGQTYRVLRGGSWSSYDSIVYSAYRYEFIPTNVYYYIGFRCAHSVQK